MAKKLLAGATIGSLIGLAYANMPCQGLCPVAATADKLGPTLIGLVLGLIAVGFGK
jgi:hypothetical protein